MHALGFVIVLITTVYVLVALVLWVLSMRSGGLLSADLLRNFSAKMLR
jgi:hypothetical protein